MATSNTSGFISRIAPTAVSYGVRVKINSDGAFEAAGVADIGQAVTLADAADGQNVAAQLYSQGTVVVKTNTADTVTAGGVAYAAAGGLVAPTATTPVTIGIYAEGATANNSYVEVIPLR